MCLWQAADAQHAPPATEDTSIVRLTTAGARNGQPCWSPDGRTIAFVSNRSGRWQAWAAAADGSAPRQLTRDPEPVGWPTWNHDGTAIFYYARVQDHYRIKLLTLASGEVRELLEGSYSDFRPLLSPGGSALLFDRYGASTPPNHDLFVFDFRTGATRRLTFDPGYDSDARWSPDQRSVVFHSDRGASRFQTQVYRLDLESGRITRLTDGPAVNAYPSWSPDGRRYRIHFGAGRKPRRLDHGRRRNEPASTHAPPRIRRRPGVDARRNGCPLQHRPLRGAGTRNHPRPPLSGSRPRHYSRK